MSKLTDLSFKKLNRVVRYLVKRPRLIMHFYEQPEPEVIDVYSDANWAG